MATTAPYAKSIDQFRGKFAEMARPNLFQVSIYLPKTQLTPLQPVNDALVTSTQDNEGQGTTSLDELTQFMVKAASFPASTIGVVEVPFRGRQLKIAGDRTYEPWSVTVLNRWKHGHKPYKSIRSMDLLLRVLVSTWVEQLLINYREMVKSSNRLH